MTKMAIKPRKSFIRNIPLNNLFWTKKSKTTQNKIQTFFGLNHCKADGPSISEHTDIQPLYNKLWDNLFSEVGQCSFPAAKKSLFSSFLDTKQFFAMKWASHHYKQLTPSESWNRDGFLSLGLGYHQIKSVGLEFLQRCGHQIKVNTWTGS